MGQAQIKTMVAMLDEAYGGPAWHGPCLRSSLRGVTAEQAEWRPGQGRHNIWEVAVHAAYWKYAVRRRIMGEKQGSFGEKGSNWFTRPKAESSHADASAWRQDLAQLARAQRELRAAVLELSDRDLDRRSQGSRHTVRRMIAGIAMHDVYHAGQIQLLKRLQQSSD